MNIDFEEYRSIVSFFGKSLPATHEVIIFDASEPELPALLCINRKSGTHRMSRRIVSEILQKKSALKRSAVMGIPAQNENGRFFKTSIYFIKDDDDCVTHVVCINIDCGVYMELQTLASSILQFSNDDFDLQEEKSIYESYGYSSNTEPSLDMIDKVVTEFEVEPERISPDERFEIMCDLYDLGVFEMKGAVAKTADTLKISEQSIYRYLSKIKKARQ